jgi:hypothetical protein
MAGCKPYEFRIWPAPRHVSVKRIAIQAAARPVRKAEVAEWFLRPHGPGRGSYPASSRALQTASSSSRSARARISGWWWAKP